MMNQFHMPRPKTPTANEKEAAFLVSRADPDFLSSAIKAVSTKKEKAKDKKKFPKPTVQGSDSLRGELGACPKVLKLSPPNLGPNQSGHVPQPFGLLDFQDIALFLWPPYRQHDGFDLEEQCLILKHRNSRLRDITMEDLVEIQAWMDRSETITVEENSVNIREWRLWLSNEELEALTSQMDEDLSRATSLINYMRTESAGGNSMAMKRSQKLAALRSVQDEED